MNNDFNKKLPNNITTERLILRTPILDDVDAITELANNKNLHKWLARLPYPYKEEHGVDFVKNLARTKEEHAYIICNKKQDILGIISLHKTDNGFELGYWLGEPYWGKGYISEASKALIKTAIELGFDKLHARAISSNIGSIKVLQKCGFIIEDERIDDCGQHKGIMVTYLKYEKSHE